MSTRIRSFDHALTLIADTMLPWELTPRGSIRCDVPGRGDYPLRYCPLCAVAQVAKPDAPAPSGIFPDDALPWAGYTISTPLMWRIMDVADNRGGVDRALLLTACGLS